MVRFLHSADWQLGMLRHVLEGEAQARYGQARIDAIERIGAAVTATSASFVVVAGDVFETNHVDRNVVRRAVEALRSVPCPVYLLPGNHDPLEPGSLWVSPSLRADLPRHVEVLDDTEPRCPLPGVEVIGVPWRTRRPDNDPVLGVWGGGGEPGPPAPARPGVLRVLVGHGAVDTLAPGGGDDPATVSLRGLEETLASGRVHYIALGDRHSTTTVGASGRIWYAGTPEPTRPEERDPGQVLAVELDAERCQVEPVRVGSWRFLSEVVEVDDGPGLELLRQWLDGQPDKARTVVRLGLRGSLGLAAHTRLEALLDSYADVFAALQRWRRHTDLTLRPDQADLDGLGLTGPARGALTELADAARAGDGEAADALALLHRLASGLTDAAAERSVA